MSENNGEAIEEVLSNAVARERQGGMDAAQILLSDPSFMQAFQYRLAGLIGSSSGLIESLPKSVRRRIDALKKLQSEHLQLEIQFHAEVAELEKKYAALFAPLYDKRKNIVKGEHEPTDDECKWRSEEDEDDEEEADKEDEAEESKADDKAADGADTESTKADDGKKADDDSKEEEEEGQADEDVKGVNDFWLTCLKNHPLISEMIHEQDTEILTYLEDIRFEYLEGINTGFKLLFYFSENPFFTNNVLEKTYHLKPEPESPDDLIYDGPLFQSATGTDIDWKGKDPTVKIIKKKQRKKGGPDAGKTRTVVKQIEQESFFNFFKPPNVSESNLDEEIAQSLAELVHEDYSVGDIIKEKIIPHAVLWFTGEAQDYEDMEFDEEEEEEDDDLDGEGDEDEDDDPDYEPPQGEQPPECKQS